MEMNMSVNYPIAHENYVPAYQTSATPFVTASAVTTVDSVSFPYVSRFFTVQNRSALELRVGFTQLGVDHGHHPAAHPVGHRE